MMTRVFMLMFILAFNVFLFFGQSAVDGLAASENVSSQNFFDYQDSLIGQYDTGNYTINQDIAGELPESQAKVEPDTGNIFTDTFSSIKGWLLKTTGAQAFINWFTALPNFLSVIGLPAPIVFGIGVFWHILTIYLFVTLLTGRS